MNRWERYAAWPPKAEVTAKKLYLLPEKQLGFAAPGGGVRGEGGDVCGGSE